MYKGIVAWCAGPELSPLQTLAQSLVIIIVLKQFLVISVFWDIQIWPNNHLRPLPLYLQLKAQVFHVFLKPSLWFKAIHDLPEPRRTFQNHKETFPTLEVIKWLWYSYFFWQFRVPSRCFLFDSTVPSRCFLFDGTVLSRKRNTRIETRIEI